jgi:hypothetical protein
MEADHLLTAACDQVWQVAREELRTTPLAVWTEGVFRYFFVRELLRANPEARCQIEWHRVDLLLQALELNLLVEFKFYTSTTHHHLDGSPRTQRKGGAGIQNVREFWACVRSLREYRAAVWAAKEAGRIDGCYLILAFVREQGRDGIGSYPYWYDPLRPDPDSPTTAESIHLLHGIDSACCRRSGQELALRLFRVSPATVV